MTEIELQYNYCLQSVLKIAELKAILIKSDDDLLDLESNKDYLQQMLAKDYWTTEDLTPLKNAIV